MKSRSGHNIKSKDTLRSMATPQSPSRMFNGLDEDIYNEAKYAHEINDKMRVPKRIKATGEYSDEDYLLSNQNGLINSWNYHDKIDMNVPDRIVVLGHDQHLETRSAPLEIQLENSLMPKAPVQGIVRVPSPPRVITLNDHHFPSASGSDNEADDELCNDELQPPLYYSSKRANTFNHQSDGLSTESESQHNSGVGNVEKRNLLNHNNDISMVTHRDGTPTGELAPNEEIVYLRKKLSNLNRRIMNIEISNERRMQRDQIVYCLGLAYFVLKTIIWLNRN